MNMWKTHLQIYILILRFPALTIELCMLLQLATKHRLRVMRGQNW